MGLKCPPRALVFTVPFLPCWISLGGSGRFERWEQPVGGRSLKVNNALVPIDASLSASTSKVTDYSSTCSSWKAKWWSWSEHSQWANIDKHSFYILVVRYFSHSYALVTDTDNCFQEE